MYFFFVDEKGMERLILGFKLSIILKGVNVIIMVFNDEGIFFDVIELVLGIVIIGVI